MDYGDRMETELVGGQATCNDERWWPTDTKRHKTNQREVEGYTSAFVHNRSSSNGNHEARYPSDTDYLEGILHGSTGYFLSQGGVVSSWLCHLSWISQATQSSCALPCAQEPAYLLRQEIQSLTQQLVQVKRRLFPAAEQFAECAAEEDPEYAMYQQSAHEAFQAARSRCNPLEILGEKRTGSLASIFMNRAAVKLANIDALVDFCLTQTSEDCQNFTDPPSFNPSSTTTTTTIPQNLNHEEDPFIFVDLCGAPGGFSEYITHRCQYEGSCPPGSVFGYGMSLIGTNEHGTAAPWRMNRSVYLKHACLGQYRICEGADGTGNIYVWENVQHLIHLMEQDAQQRIVRGSRRRTSPANNGHSNPSRPLESRVSNAKAHLVVADGGFDAQRDVEDQESIAQKLIVCEVAAALAVLRSGGSFVLKLFGFQTDVVRAVLADLMERFDDMIVVKPISSRPASAERYLVCYGFRGLETGWTGPSWRNKMFLGESYSDKKLDGTTYFDRFDRDMLQLNLKSCFAILTHLENRRMRGEWGYGDSDNDEHASNGKQGGLSSRTRIHFAAYKAAWRLM